MLEEVEEGGCAHMGVDEGEPERVEVWEFLGLLAEEVDEIVGEVWVVVEEESEVLELGEFGDLDAEEGEILVVDGLSGDAQVEVEQAGGLGNGEGERVE